MMALQIRFRDDAEGLQRDAAPDIVRIGTSLTQGVIFPLIRRKHSLVTARDRMIRIHRLQHGRVKSVG
jgi:hypothetical protein